MRPLQLTIQAFGPFAKREVIDFTALGVTPLFLINGVTGAGKSAILDAICFALYGKTTADEREAVEMRCDHADPVVLTEVSLTFQLHQSRYRVRRVPVQDRPKSRGEGVTQQPAEASLWQIEADEERLISSRKVGECDRAIQQLLGLTADQFRQVMVLPQGKFRELILANSSEREAILGTLFQTEIYQQLEKRLSEQAKTVAQQLGEIQRRQMALLQSGEVADRAAVRGELDQLLPQQEAAAAAKVATQQAHTEAIQAEQQATLLQQQLEEWRRQEQQWAEQQAQQPQIAAQQQQLEQAQRAAQLQPLDRQVESGRTAVARQVAQQQQNRQQLAEAQQQLQHAQQQQAAAQQADREREPLQQQRHQLQQIAAQLPAWQRAEERVVTLTTTLHRQQQQLQQLQQQLQRCAEQQQHCRQQSEQLATALDSSAAEPMALLQLNAQLAQRQQFDTLTAQQQSLAQERQQSELALQQAQQQLEAAQRPLLDLEYRWHCEQAARLAAELQPDHPCPVCGSLDHPQPAKTPDGLKPVTQAELEKAKRRVELLAQGVMTARERLQAVAVRFEIGAAALEQAAVAVNSLPPLVELEGQQQQSVARLAERERQQQQLTQIKQQLEVLAAEQIRLQAVEQPQQQALEASQREVLYAQAELESLAQQIPASQRDPKQVAGQLQRVEQRLEQLHHAQQQAAAALEQAVRAVVTVTAQGELLQQSQQEAEAALHQSEVLWQQALHTSPFATVEAFRAAQLSETVQQQLQQRIEAAQSRLQQQQGRVELLRQQLADQQPPDLAQLQAHRAELQQQLAQSEQALSRLEQRHRELTKLDRQLEELATEQQQWEQQYALYGTLSEVASGKSGSKISLQRFVLSVLLEDVLALASRRLLTMSQGRYRLRRKIDRAKGRAASGLELEVDDEYTGKSRPVATLSGGESFMAALALALGLSDVVQSYAGGVKLDTLFIDEGFGSLDPEALELAIRTLIDLQQGGRMVGIISHVAELKEQIQRRIEVIRSRSGSTIELRGLP